MAVRGVCCCENSCGFVCVYLGVECLGHVVALFHSEALRALFQSSCANYIAPVRVEGSSVTLPVFDRSDGVRTGDGGLCGADITPSRWSGRAAAGSQEPPAARGSGTVKMLQLPLFFSEGLCPPASLPLWPEGCHSEATRCS